MYCVFYYQDYFKISGNKHECMEADYLKKGEKVMVIKPTAVFYCFSLYIIIMVCFGLYNLRQKNATNVFMQ